MYLHILICGKAPNLVKLVVKTPIWLGNNPNVERIALRSFFSFCLLYTRLTTQIKYDSMYIVRKGVEMNNEIKEILELFGSTDENVIFGDIVELNSQQSHLLLDYITNLQENLEVSQTNEETYRLEMQDITKILGLDECTLFDDVKKYATNLQQKNERLKLNHKQLKDIEKMAISNSKLIQENERLKERVAYLENGSDDNEKVNL